MLDFELVLGPFRLAFTLSSPVEAEEAAEPADYADLTSDTERLPVGFAPSHYEEEDE